MKKKLLIFSNNFPYPLTHGGAIAQFYFLKNLSNKFEVIYCTLVYNEIQEQYLNQLSIKLPTVKIIPFTCTHRVPRAGIPPSFWFRVKKRLKSFVFGRSRHHLYSSVTNKFVNDFENPYLLNPLPIYSEDFINFFCELIDKENIDVVQIDFYEAISLLKAVPKNIKKVFVHHEIRTKRLQLAAQKEMKSDAFKKYLTSCYEVVEYNMLKDADRIIVFNEDDFRFLNAYNSNIFLSPFGIPDELVNKQSISQSFNHLLFIGGERHSPNMSGLRWFLDEVYLPHKEEINIPVFVVGDWSASFINHYNEHPEIRFLGIVEDMKEHYENAIMIAPILSGSGLRTKILTAFANRIPVMSTSFAAEGLLSKEGLNNHICLFDNPGQFVSKINEISNDLDRVTFMAELGFKFYSENFDNHTLFELRYNALSFDMN